VAQLASTDRRSDFERWYAAQPRVPLIVPNEGAKVLIVDFSDFQCPYCRQAYAALKPIIDKYNAVAPNTVRLVLKDFPLDSKCNSGVQNGGPHPFACEAAVAVRLAKAKGHEQALEEYLFANRTRAAAAVSALSSCRLRSGRGIRTLRRPRPEATSDRAPAAAACARSRRRSPS
jgi:hypothetical protein